jgi:DNA-binding IclR family transcriptional regulator
MTQKDTDEPALSPAVVKSAGRVFEVLELFRRSRRQLSAAEIGQALGYPKSSTNALLKSLVALGYLVLDARTLRYFPSLAVTQLGDWIPSIVLASGDAFEILAEVHAATQETVTLSVQNDLACRFLRVIPGTFPISLRMTEGFVAPLLTTAVGTAILSQLTDDEIAALVDRANDRAKRKTERVDGAKVAREVREVRTRGYAVAYDAVFPDTGAIAVPFPSDMDGFPMAIGVGGLRERMRRNEGAIYRSIRASLGRHHGRRTRTGRRAAV